MDEQYLETIFARLKSEEAAARVAAIRELCRFVNISAYEDAPQANSRNATAEDVDAWDSAVVRLLNRPDISEAFIDSLEDASAEVRSWAAIQAGRLSDSRAKESLIRHLLSDPSPHVRLMCAMLPPTHGGAEVVSALVQALKDPFPKVAAAACTMLRRMGDRSAISGLREMLNNDAWEVRFEACYALLELGASDSAIVRTIEALQNSPEANEHDRMVREFNKPQNDPIPKVEHTPLVNELLDRARGSIN